MRVPVATYRLQVNADSPLHDAAGSAEYLHALGISDLYLSPIFEALPGSTHGYDVTDPTSVRAAIGGRAAFDALSVRARALGMGVLLDIVPNHMAASEHGAWWRDVLRHGPASPFAHYFDIDWGTATEPRPLLLPILGAPLPEVIAQGGLELAEDGVDGECSLVYAGRRLPLALECCPEGAVAQYRSAAADRRQEILRDLLAHQHYRLEHWLVAGERLGYRRFFDVTDLAGLRVERPEVFAATHTLVLELARAGQVSGLRVDHVDGLRDPAGYLERLRAEAGTYTLVEKILERSEPLPPWPVAGTTGYDFLNLLNGLFIDADGHTRIGRAYLGLTGQRKSFPEIVREKKLLVLEHLFGGERTALAQLLRPLLGAACDAPTAERVLVEITVALPVYRTYIRPGEYPAHDQALLEQVLAASAERLGDVDPEVLARLRRVLLLEDHGSDGATLEFLQRWQQLTGPVMAKGVEDTALYAHTAFIAANEVGGNPAEPCVSIREFHRCMRERAAAWPHALSATATHDTKRGEDTRARLDVLSERADEWARLLREWASRSEAHKEEAVASAGLEGEEAPVPNAREESLLYQTLLGTWPMTGEAGPEFIARIKQYMVKALREAKESTSWHSPDPDYESVLAEFVDQLLAEPWWPGLREEIRAYAGTIAWHGALNSLSQTLLKIACPGVPDFYQGTELWSLALVDPDNRRPVDYEERRARLRALEPVLDRPSTEALIPLLDEWRTGDIKLYVTAAALRFRRRRAHLFAGGAYLPLVVRGRAADHVIAFARTSGDEAAICVVPRLLARLCERGEIPSATAWADTEIQLPAEPGQRAWRNVLTGERHRPDGSLRLSALLRTLPLALLE